MKYQCPITLHSYSVAVAASWESRKSVNSYAQKLSTGNDRLLKSPEITLDSCAYLTRSVRFTRSSRARSRGSSNRAVHLLGVLCLGLGLTSITMQPLHAASQIDSFKLYAHSRIVNFEQYECFVKLIDRENRSWNPLAIGNLKGTHKVYGIGQMKNDKYRTLDGYTQIDWSLRYIKNRYQTPCKAWEFFKKNGYH